jgi:hypothetical protein
VTRSRRIVQDDTPQPQAVQSIPQPEPEPEPRKPVPQQQQPAQSRISWIKGSLIFVFKILKKTEKVSLLLDRHKKDFVSFSETSRKRFSVGRLRGRGVAEKEEVSSPKEASSKARSKAKSKNEGKKTVAVVENPGELFLSRKAVLFPFLMGRRRIKNDRKCAFFT